MKKITLPCLSIDDDVVGFIEYIMPGYANVFPRMRYETRYHR